MSADPRLGETVRSSRSIRLLVALAIAVCAWDTRVVYGALHGGQFRTDAWLMIAGARSLRTFLDTEWTDLLNPAVERFRPLTHIVIGGWYRLTGGGGLALALIFWLLVLGVVALQGLFVARLGFRRDTAVITAAWMAGSPGVLLTTYAHQYNDLVMAALFDLLALNLCFGPRRRSPLLLAMLVTAAMCAHESGVLAGPLLLIALAIARPSRPWREQLARADVLGVLLPTLWYGLFRVLAHTPGASGLVSSGAIVRNVVHLFTTILRDRLESLAIAAAAAAWLFVRGRVTRRDEAYRLGLAVGWFVVAYAPYLLNAQYRSLTYLCVAPLMLGAVLIDPVCAAVESNARLARYRLAILVALLVALHGFRSATVLDADDRIVEPMATALRAAIPSGAPSAIDVWIFEDEHDDSPDAPSFAAGQLAVYDRSGSSIALDELIPGHAFRVHTASIRGASDRVLPCGTPTFALTGGRHHFRLWHLQPERAPVRWSGAADTRDVLPSLRWSCGESVQ